MSHELTTRHGRAAVHARARHCGDGLLRREVSNGLVIQPHPACGALAADGTLRLAVLLKTRAAEEVAASALQHLAVREREAEGALEDARLRGPF